MAETWAGRCYCGAVRFEATGDPVAEGFCHCDTCRRWSAMPMTDYALWPAPSVRFTAGEDRVLIHDPEGRGGRMSCAVCGGAIGARLAAQGMVDLFPLLFEGRPFRPAAHINYAERVVDMHDDLPKFVDMPEAAGGSGRMVAD